MAKKKQKHNKQGSGLNAEIKRLAQEKAMEAERERDVQKTLSNISVGEKPVLTDEIYLSIQKQLSETGERQLGLNFMYITENSDYNLSYFRTNKTVFDVFVTRLDAVFKAITSHKVKDIVGNPIFNDKFQYSTLYKGTHKTSGKIFNEDQLIISASMGGKKNERIILCQENPTENILYVLGFDFNHNMYKHGS